MGRTPCCDKVGMNRGAWTAREDEMLKAYVEKHGPGQWRALPRKAGLARCGKSCRFRWMNYLRPNIKRGNYTQHEEETIIKLHAKFGNRWSLIAARLPGRTDNEIKNVWHTHLKKRHENQQLNIAHHHVQQDHPYPLIFTDPTSDILDMNLDSNSPTYMVSEDSTMVQQYEDNFFDGRRSVMSSNMLRYNNGCLQDGFYVNDSLDIFDTIDKQDQAEWSSSGYGSPSDNGEEDTMKFWISVLMKTNVHLDI